MTIGIVHDLAVGAHPGGADAWARQDVFVRGFSVGAPPDEFNQRGQDWTLPPWHPGHLAAQGYRPLADLIAAAAGAGGGLRMDHVMGLSRLWWIPAGMSPQQGAYVRYDGEAMLGVLAGSAAAAGAVAIGEDLGTVEPWLREALPVQGVLGTSMLWFERGWSGEPLAPQWWRRYCLATVSTHDLPPAAAFLTGSHVTDRVALGLLTRPENEERAEAAKTVDSWLEALYGEGLLPAGSRPDADAFTAALYGYLARTPALLIGVSLAEAAGECRSQNIPGTTTEYPNWRMPLCGPDGSPVPLDDLQSSDRVRTIARAAAGLPEGLEGDDGKAGALAALAYGGLELLVDAVPVVVDTGRRNVVRKDAMPKQPTALGVRPEPAFSVEVVLLGVDLHGDACVSPPGIDLADVAAIRRAKKRVEHGLREVRALNALAEAGLGDRPDPVAHFGERRTQVSGVPVASLL
jgi:hypothetical protein